MGDGPTITQTSEGLILLDQALDLLAGCDPASLSDPGSICWLHKARCRLDAVSSRATAAFEASEAYAADGAHSTTAWMSAQLRAPRSEVQKTLRFAKVLDRLPAFAESFLAGRVGSAQLSVIAAALNDRTEAAILQDEVRLVRQAEELAFSQFRQAVTYRTQLADPDGAEQNAERLRARRSVFLGESIFGSFLGKITLDPVAGTVVLNELNRLEEKLFEHDRKEGAERLGRDARSGGIVRTPAQRRADALVEMAKRSASMPGNAREPRPLFSVLVDFPTLQGRICELARGTVVTPGSLLPYLDEAIIERAVYRSRTRIEVGEQERLFSGATRRAIELRDRRCTHPYCDRPVEICQIDHIVPYSRNGPTTQENGRLLCSFHNRLRNREKDPPSDP